MNHDKLEKDVSGRLNTIKSIKSKYSELYSLKENRVRSLARNNVAQFKILNGFCSKINLPTTDISFSPNIF